MPIVALAPIITGSAIAISKSKENKARKGRDNYFSKTYPLTNDCASQQEILDKALLDLKRLETWDAKTKGEKRIKSRDTNALKNWLLIMREHLRDLSCGINVASTTAPAPAANTVDTPSAPLPIQPAAPIESDAPMATVTSDDVPFGMKEGEQNLAAGTAKKGVNWLLIGGVVIGAYFIFKYLKKK